MNIRSTVLAALGPVALLGGTASAAMVTARSDIDTTDVPR